MSQALGSLGDIFSGGGGGVPGWMKLILGGLTGAGEIGNIMADRQRAGLLDKEKAWMNLTPQQLAARVSAATKPLDAGLTQGVGNVVQAEMGERGLAQAPGIFAASESQALAPYYQQNQQNALNAILQQMLLPATAAQMLPGQTSLSPLLALLLKSFQKPNTDFGSVPGVTPDITAGNNVDIMSQVGNFGTPPAVGAMGSP